MSSHRRNPEPPLVCVLLPAFNADAWLTACLRSIQRQSERRWHCIVVDDGSSDSTAQCARALRRDDARIEVVTRPHGGLVPALNSALEHCGAPFVARMDADDLMHRDRLAAQLALLSATPQLGGVGCHVRSFPRRALTQGWRTYERWLNGMHSAAQVRRDAFIESPIAHPTWMMRRDILVRFGYRDCAWPEDYDLLLRLLAAGIDIGVVPRRLLCWRDHPQRLTRRSPTYSLQALTACRAAFLAGGLLAGHERYILWGYGSTGRALAGALQAHGKAPAYIVELHPGRLGNRIHGAAVIPHQRLASIPRLPLIASVAGERPRTLIRAALDADHWVEGRDYLCAA